MTEGHIDGTDSNREVMYNPKECPEFFEEVSLIAPEDVVILLRDAYKSSVQRYIVHSIYSKSVKVYPFNSRSQK